MAGTRRIVRNDRTRVWLMEGGAGPFVTPTYEGLMKAGTPRLQKGQKTPVTNPNPDNYGEFDIIDEIAAARTNPQLTLTGRYAYEVSKLLRIANQDCPNDVQVHIGLCEDPKSFNEGWQKILALEEATADDWGTGGDLGALNEGDRAVVDETSTLSGRRLYEILPISLAESGAVVTEREIIDIAICDRATCAGACGAGSDGCSKIFAVETFGGSSPSSLPSITYSDDGGANWTSANIDSLTGAEAPNAVACVGRNVVVISEDSESLHYAAADDIIEGTDTWLEVTTGFNTGNGPLDIFSLGAGLTWIVGEGGYIYFSEDVTAGVEIQDAGSATVQNLNRIHGFDSENLIAVGASNAVVRTSNGGNSWGVVTGPAVGVALQAAWMRSADEWVVGSAGGILYATRNGGRTWTTVLTIAAGVITDVKFSTRMVGWLTATVGGAGRLYRTIDGGNSWYVTPEGLGAMPTNQRLNRIAICNNANHAFAGGLGTSTDGFIVEAA